MLSKQLLKNLFQGIAKRLLPQKTEGPTISIGWFQKKVLKHLPGGKTRSIRLWERPFYYEAPQELLHGLQEIFVDQIYKQTLSANPTIIDCGANIGLSVLYLKKQHPTATILAFEPDPLNFSLLQQNIASFQLADIQCLQAAVWIENKSLSFSSQKGMASGISTTEHENCIEVKGIRLKDYLNQPIDFLKIDIEGAEWEVLKDCSSQLTMVKNLFVEYHGQFEEQYKLSEILNLLQQAGFKYYIREAAALAPHPFLRAPSNHPYEVQLNIFGFR